ncbi:9810_t:CDS:2 [Gigaspora margarita]|uniref:9810_t:CDS:1 n=1 Tax=Gigaspora margarita TaxID=4874 RepID=A0ABN7UZ19_GIGMA|nr:9810_t:CDS:2 [Gigaspora margarita]
MAKQQNKKQKVNNTGNDKENVFYNSYDVLNSSMFTEHNTDINSLTWGDKVELELNALKDTMNIWNNSTEPLYMEQEETQKLPMEGVNQEPTINEIQQEEQTLEQELMQDSVEEKDQDTLSLQGEKADLITKKGNEKHEAPEQVPYHAPTPDTVIDNMAISMSIVDAQTQQPVECPVEREKQTNTGSSLFMNDVGTGMIEPTTKNPVTQEVHMTETPDKREYTVTQLNNPEVPSIPEYMRGNKNLRDKLDMLPSTSSTTAQSNEYLDPKLSKTTMESTEPNDPEWSQPDEFTTLINKRSTVSRKKSSCEELIKIPKEYKDKYEDTLDYIKEGPTDGGEPDKGTTPSQRRNEHES